MGSWNIFQTISSAWQLTDVLFDFRVSSVLNRDVKQYGKKYLFDCNEETCWNSDQVKQLLVSFRYCSLYEGDCVAVIKWQHQNNQFQKGTFV